MNPALNSDIPPPPPPKPNSNEVSRGGTPQANLPLSQQASNPELGDGNQPPHSAEMDYIASLATLPKPPTLEEGWVPDAVKDKSTIDLQTILKDPGLIFALSTLHPSYIAHRQQLQSLLKYNQDLARHLLKLQSHLAELRASSEGLLLIHQSHEVSWRKKQAEMDAALAPWSPKALYQRLAASVVEQEAVCQAVEESFLEEDHQGRATEKEVVDWVKRVRAEATKLAARREAKARWDEGRVGGWR